MKEFKNARKNVGAAISRPHIEENAKRRNKERGITLIALIITIVVMLIMVVVSIQIALDTGLFETAGKATKDWEVAQEKEGELSSGKVNIGGTVYNSVEEYTSLIGNGESGEVDFEKLFATAKKHPEQSETNNDIGIAEDGSIVNMDLWFYDYGRESYALGGAWSPFPTGYSNEDIINGKIQGRVPMYIKEENATEFYPVVSMELAFAGCVDLVEAPEIPSSVTNMWDTFHGCRSLTEAPEIPSSVTCMYRTFSDCTSLTEAPVIPSSVTDMRWTFEGCTSLTGTLTINANPTSYSACLSGAATNEGCNLVLNGSSTVLNEILATKSDNSKITIGN